MKNQLGEPLGTNSDAKLACETEIWSQDGHVDVIWRAKRHQVRAQRVSWGAQGGAKGAPKRYAHHWDSPTGVMLEPRGPPISILAS